MYIPPIRRLHPERYVKMSVDEEQAWVALAECHTVPATPPIAPMDSFIGCNKSDSPERRITTDESDNGMEFAKELVSKVDKFETIINKTFLIFIKEIMFRVSMAGSPISLRNSDLRLSVGCAI